MQAAARLGDAIGDRAEQRGVCLRFGLERFLLGV